MDSNPSDARPMVLLSMPGRTKENNTTFISCCVFHVCLQGCNTFTHVKNIAVRAGLVRGRGGQPVCGVWWENLELLWEVR